MDIADEMPGDLGPSGSRFWIDTHSVFDLDPSDIPILAQICRTLDEIDQLAAVVASDGVMSLGSTGQPVVHPALAGLRAHRLLLDRLMIRLALPDSAGVAPLTVGQLRGKRAADVRWAPHRAQVARRQTGA